MRKMVSVICENCKEEFNKSLSEYKRSENLNRKHFCSLKCSKAFNKSNTNKKVCLNCNGIFYDYHKKRKFCSRKCSISYSNKNRKLSNNAKEKISNSITKVNKELSYSKRKKYNQNPSYCKECGFKLDYKKRNNKYCDILCKRKSDSRRLNDYQKYKKECQFNFNLSDYPNEFNFSLIEKLGWYKAKNHGNNINGVSRDHMISINYGYRNNIDSKIISHPANCELMKHSDNSRKNSKNSITLDDLLKRINDWDLKYK